MDAREHLDMLERVFERITMQLMAINATLQKLTSIPNPTPSMLTQFTDTTMMNGMPNTGSKLKPAPLSDFDVPLKSG